MNRFKKFALLFALTFVVAACASAPVKKSYILTTDTHNVITGNALLPSLMIAQVRSANRQSTDMTYSRKTNEVESFTKSDWVMPPNQMLQAAIAQDLNARNFFQYVIVAPNSVAAQYRLDLTIVEMNQFFNEQTKQSEIILTLQARLVRSSDNRIVKSFRYSKVEPSLTYNAEGGVVAYNRALQAIANELTQDLTQTFRR